MATPRLLLPSASAASCATGVGPDEPAVEPGYASRRWARLIQAIAGSVEDVRTLDQWSQIAGVSVGAIRTWCRAAGVSARRSLALGRLLRVVMRSGGRPWRPYEMLDIVDSRTMQRLLARGGLPSTATNAASSPSVEAFLAHQTFVREAHLLDWVHQYVNESWRDPSCVTD
jgi:hypothetical protein